MAEALGLCQVQDTAGQIEAEERAAKLPAPGSLRTNGKPPANGQHSREAVSMPTRPQLDAAPADESLVHSESPCGIPGLARPPLALARCGGGCVRRCGCPRGAALCAVTSPRLQAAALAAWGVIASVPVCACRVRGQVTAGRRRCTGGPSRMRSAKRACIIQLGRRAATAISLRRAAATSTTALKTTR